MKKLLQILIVGKKLMEIQWWMGSIAEVLKIKTAHTLADSQSLLQTPIGLENKNIHKIIDGLFNFRLAASKYRDFDKQRRPRWHATVCISSGSTLFAKIKATVVYKM